MSPNSFDEITYSTQELEEQRAKLVNDRRRISDELEKLKTEYKELINEGSDVEGCRQKKYAAEAKLLKKKWEVQKEHKKRNTARFATVLLVVAVRELLDRCDRDITDIDVILDDPDVDSDDVTASIWESISKYNLDHKIVAKVQNELGLDLITIEVGPEPWYSPIPKDTQVDFVDINIEADTESDPLEDFEDRHPDLDSGGQ